MRLLFTTLRATLVGLVLPAVTWAALAQSQPVKRGVPFGDIWLSAISQEVSAANRTNTSTVPGQPLEAIEVTLQTNLYQGRLGYIVQYLTLQPDTAQAKDSTKALRSVAASISGKNSEARTILNGITDPSDSISFYAFAQALVYETQGNSEAALDWCRRVPKADPAQHLAYALESRIHLARTNLLAAYLASEKAIALAPNYAPAHKIAGSVALLSGDHVPASTAYTRAVQIDEQDWEAHYGLALAQEISGSYQLALQSLTTANRLAPTNALVLRKLATAQLAAGLVDQAILTASPLAASGSVQAKAVLCDAHLQAGNQDVAAKWLAELPNTEIQFHLLQAYLHIVSQRYEDARSSLRAAVTLEPTHEAARLATAVLEFFLSAPRSAESESTPPSVGVATQRFLNFVKGCEWLHQGNEHNARERFAEAENFLPGFSLAGLDFKELAQPIHQAELRHTALAILLHLRNMPRAGLSVLQPILDSTPKSPLAHYWAAVFRIKLQDRRKALELLQNSIAVAPRFFSALFVTAELQTAAGASDLGSILYQRAAEVRPDPGIFLRLGLYYEGKQQLDAAESQYRSLIRTSTNFFVGYNQLAWLLARQGKKLDEALALARQAESLQPGNASVLDTLGWILHQLQQPEEARLALEKARRVNPDNPTIWFHLGTVLASQGKKDLARQAALRSTQLATNTAASETAIQAKRLLQQLER
jgi:tetratricopeptide (TPR) repeat protein